MAREVIGDLGLYVASAVAHGVSADDPSVAPAIAAMVSLAQIASHPPRDSIYTYVTYNTLDHAGNPLRSFTGSPHEAAFIRRSAHAGQLYNRAAAALVGLDLRQRDARDRLNEALHALLGLPDVFRSFLDSEARAIESAWFRESYKRYFPPLVIEGLLWEPPSGAHLHGVQALDLILDGLVESDHRQAIRERRRYLLPEDRALVELALDRPSVRDQVREAPYLPLRILLPLRQVVSAFAEASAVHWSALHYFLIRPRPDTEALPTQVPNSEHVLSYESVKALMRLRRNNPLLQELERLGADDGQ